MSAEVREILDRIEHLPESEQLELRAELARQDEQEWGQLLTQARKKARQDGLDDDTIARAVESLRYEEKTPKR